jgi:hypothetical protein
MIKWLAYIVVLLIFAPCLSSAKIKNNRFTVISNTLEISLLRKEVLIDTINTKNTKKQEQDKKIKEVAKAKRQPKPEKLEPVDNTATAPKPKPKRQRRPEGMERPPEIPRRSGN